MAAYLWTLTENHGNRLSLELHHFITHLEYRVHVTKKNKILLHGQRKVPTRPSLRLSAQKDPFVLSHLDDTFLYPL